MLKCLPKKALQIILYSPNCLQIEKKKKKKKSNHNFVFHFRKGPNASTQLQNNIQFEMNCARMLLPIDKWVWTVNVCLQLPS